MCAMGTQLKISKIFQELAENIREEVTACADPKIPAGGPGVFFFIFYVFICFFSQRVIWISLKAIGPKGSDCSIGSNCISRGSLQVFLRKQIATCVFPAASRPPTLLLIRA